jgi:hypothetical protein
LFLVRDLYPCLLLYLTVIYICILSLVSINLTVIMHGADVLVQAEGLAPRVGPLIHRLVLPLHLHLNVLNTGTLIGTLGDVKFGT